MWLRISACAILFVTLGVVLSSPQNAPPQQPDNPAQAKKSVRVPTTVMVGRFEHKAMPVYPEEAMSKGIQGDVWLNIEVDETGKIGECPAKRQKAMRC